MALLAQSTYTIKRIPKENYRFDLSAETIVLPANSSGAVTDYAGAKVDLKLSYDGKEIYPNYDERLEDEIGGRNLLDTSLIYTDGAQITYGNSITYNLNGTARNKNVRYRTSKLVQNTKYILSFKIKKTSGDIVTIGGHFTNVINIKVFRDGLEQSGNWSSARNYPNDDLEHRYEIYFERTVDNGTDLLYIQPNRASYTYDYTALIYDLQIASGTKPSTDWTPAPEDLDSQITSSLVTKNCDATVTNGILSITNLTADAGYVDIPIDYGVWKQTKRVTIAKSKQGIDGVGISSIVEYYQVSASNTVAPTTWIETIPTLTASNKYLWNYEEITYTNGTSLDTLKKVIGVYGDKGTGGSDGRGIVSITNYYLATSASSGVTTGTSGWTIGVQQITTSLKFLWNYEVVKYTSGSDTVTPPALIGTFGAKGDKGEDGKSITLVDVQYAVNTSSTVPPIETSNLWKTLADTLTGSQQLWTRTKTTYSVGNPTYTTPANITPKTGGAGADGNSITSITEWYYLSTSKVAPTGGSWSTTPWTWINGMFIWTKTVFTYSKTADTETLPIVSSEWVAINDLEIGGRNLLIGATGAWKTVNAYSYNPYIDVAFKDTKIEAGQSYVFSWETELLSGSPTAATQVTIGAGVTSYQRDIMWTSRRIIGKQFRVFTPSEANLSSGNAFMLRWYTNNQVFSFRYRNLKLEKGNKPSADWTEALEDTQAKIDAAKNEALALGYLKEAIGQDATLQGALFTLVTILLKESMGSVDTAGITGIQGALKNLPAFWAGGTYAESIGGTAKAIIRHDGSSKFTDTEITGTVNANSGSIGVLTVDTSGQVKLEDPDTGSKRLSFIKSKIPLLADLLSSTNFGDSVTAKFTSLVIPSSGSVSSSMSGSLNVTKNGAEIGVAGGAVLSLNGLFDGVSDASVVMSLYLMRNGSMYSRLQSVMISKGHESDSMTVNAMTIAGVPSGSYTLMIEITKVGKGQVSGQGAVASTPMSWSFQQSGVRNFLFGLDGFLSFFSDRHIYFSEESGFDLKGPTNMPGVLASGTVSTGGVLSNEWGAKVNYGQTITGGYRIFLKDMTHNKYSVQVTPHTNVTFRVSTKTITYFEILGAGAADFVVFGSNY